MSPEVGDLVLSADGEWMVRPPQYCGQGQHPRACSCRHRRVRLPRSPIPWTCHLRRNRRPSRARPALLGDERPRPRQIDVTSKCNTPVDQHNIWCYRGLLHTSVSVFAYEIPCRIEGLMANTNPNPWDEFREILLERCAVCRRRHAGSPDAADWAIQALLNTFPVGIKCPNCQPPEGRAEVAIRQASCVTNRYEGLRLVRNQKPADDDHGPRAQAS
jgi:hypothetical protein